MTDTDRLNDPLYDRIHHFLDQFEPGTPEYGIALMVADQGVSSLKGGQIGIWEKRIVPVISRPMSDEERRIIAQNEDREAELRDTSVPFSEREKLVWTVQVYMQPGEPKHFKTFEEAIAEAKVIAAAGKKAYFRAPRDTLEEQLEAFKALGGEHGYFGNP
jgi:hypothetical protein